MTKIISGFPCIGKTTLYQTSNKRIYMDLEFRETATTKGMTQAQKDAVFNCYAQIIKSVYESAYYDYVFVTDNRLLLKHLYLLHVPYTLVVPHPTDHAYICEHHKRVLKRNNQQWYDLIIQPRLDSLRHTINLVKRYGMSVKFLDSDNQYLSDILSDL